MEKTRRCTLAGIYITDDYIDVSVGYEEPKHPLRKKDITGLLSLGPPGKDLHDVSFEGGVEQGFEAAIDWIVKAAPGVKSVGVGCYGPFVSLDHERRGTPRYGRLQSTTHGRLGERNIYQLIARAFERRGKSPLITVETDANVAALGELYWRNTDDEGWIDGWENEIIVFLKISHGIGGGAVYKGSIWGGKFHAEMGHIPVQRWIDPEVQSKQGQTGIVRHKPEAGECPYHGDCLEGLASVQGIQQFAGLPLDVLQTREHSSHKAWDREAFYLGQLCAAVCCILAPSRIVLGGRVMNTPGLLKKVDRSFKLFMGGRKNELFRHYPELNRLDYIDHDTDHEDGQVGRPGVWGALVLGALARKRRRNQKQLLDRS